jgi:hypothetical protein
MCEVRGFTIFVTIFPPYNSTCVVTPNCHTTSTSLCNMHGMYSNHMCNDSSFCVKSILAMGCCSATLLAIRCTDTESQ